MTMMRRLLRELLDALAHSAGAAELVRQRYPGLRPTDMVLAEASFDALFDRLSAAGPRAAAVADAMSDRVARVLERADLSEPPETASVTSALAMLLEQELHRRTLNQDSDSGGGDGSSAGGSGAEAEAMQLLAVARARLG